jgi:hypothetical protein
MRRHILWFPLALLLAVAAACGSGDSDDAPATATANPARTYVGAVTGTSAFLAVVDDGTRVLAYVCDGVPADPVGTVPTIQTWFNAPSAGGKVDASQGDARLQLTLTDTAMSGTVTLAGGRQLAVTGTPASGDAGLYRAEAEGSGSTAVGGWILNAAGEQRGGVGGTGSRATLSGTKTLTLSQPTFTLQGLATARIAKVGITPIPIP